MTCDGKGRQGGLPSGALPTVAAALSDAYSTREGSRCRWSLGDEGVGRDLGYVLLARTQEQIGCCRWLFNPTAASLRPQHKRLVWHCVLASFGVGFQRECGRGPAGCGWVPRDKADEGPVD